MPRRSLTPVDVHIPVDVANVVVGRLHWSRIQTLYHVTMRIAASSAPAGGLMLPA